MLADIIERHAKLGGEMASLKVTAEHVRDLEAVERELAMLDARLAASAAQLSVSVRPGAGVPVSIAGKTVTDAQSIPVTAPITVSVGDIASITVTPPPGLIGAMTKPAPLISKARPNCGAPAASPACKKPMRRLPAVTGSERNGRAWAPSWRRLASMRRRPKRLWPACARRSPRPRQAEIAEALRRAGVDALPDAAVLEKQRKALASEQEERRRRRKALEAESREAAQLLGEKTEAKAAAAGELGELRRAIAASLASLPDDRRDAEMAEATWRLQEAEKAHQQAAGALAELRGKSPAPEDVDRLNNKAARLKQAIANQKSRLAELDKTMSNLEGQIQSAGGDGIGEQVAALHEQLTQAEEVVTRHEARVDVLKLLAKTIADILSESRNRFYTPILRHLKPFLSDLFPGAELELDDRFGVAGLKRTLDQAERFDRLSDGTREQIAVIVRLAMGALLAERGRPVPITLDDALVFSDDDPISRMFDALMRAGSKQQVIVLTCRTRTFAELGGQPLSIDYDAAMAAE